MARVLRRKKQRKALRKDTSQRFKTLERRVGVVETAVRPVTTTEEDTSYRQVQSE